MLWAGKLPIHALDGTFGQYYQSRPRDEYVFDDNYFARRLFPPLRDIAVKRMTAQVRVAQSRAEAAWEQERRELEMHSEWHQVFWSRPIGIDKVSHYVLIVNGHKYELRDVSRRHDRSQIRYRTAGVAFDRLGGHAAVLSEPGNPAQPLGVYNLLLIGWTTMSHEQIHGVCRQVDRKWKYSFGFGGTSSGNCQHFTRKVADEILPKDFRASNWDWFRHDKMGPIQALQDILVQQAELLEQERRDHDQGSLPFHDLS
ncbi:hypothetical protein O9K51_04126 [Purpureocillium lavendulum]|uniref:Lipoprotein n=1 Tax=Purpureocillium lavendulum TaxID=1247861 RepID=A0AB34FUD8_9HYPO|nr:hypothetical protein O9K51_04126 [Purpureocillium lavendulum]